MYLPPCPKYLMPTAPPVVAILAITAILLLSACATHPIPTPPDLPEPQPFRQSDMTVVVSIRHYLASAERSYYHLYLYSGDGKLVRQLTNADQMSDVEPVLSPDGKQVCFRRVPNNENPGYLHNPDNRYFGPDASTTGTYHLIADVRAGSTAREIAQAPEWYRPKKEAQPQETKGVETNDSDKSPVVEEDPDTRRFRSPDGANEIVVHYKSSVEEEEKDHPAGVEPSDVTLTLVDLRASTAQRMEGLRGFKSINRSNSIHWRINRWNDGSPFLYAGRLRVAFFEAHLNSTEGNCDIAFDLNRREFFNLAPNDGFPVATPGGVPGFFFVSGERYRPLGDGKKTVNCEYLDFWNAEMKRTRFAPNLSKFGGAAAYIPGHGVTVIPPDQYAQ